MRQQPEVFILIVILASLVLTALLTYFLVK